MCSQKVEASPQAAFRQLSTLGIIGKGNIPNEYLLNQKKFIKFKAPSILQNYRFRYSYSIEESGDFNSGMDTRKISEKRTPTDDSTRMPPPKFGSSAHSSIKKRKSKRSMDYGSSSNGGSMSSLGTARSAPVTPTSDRSLSKVKVKCHSNSRMW